MKKLVVRSTMFLLRLLLFAAIVVFLFQTGRYAYGFGYQLYSNQGAEAPPGTDLAVVIYEEQSVEEIAQMLEKFGLIKDKRVFLIQERLSKYHGEIIPGNYVLNTSFSGNKIIDILTGQGEAEDHKEEDVP